MSDLYEVLFGERQGGKKGQFITTDEGRIVFIGGPSSGGGVTGGSEYGLDVPSGDSEADSIIQEFYTDWGGKPIHKDILLEVINDLRETKKRGYALTDYLEQKHGLSIGAAMQLVKIFKDYRKASVTSPRSAEESRIDRLLRTRDSTGRATARRFS